MAAETMKLPPYADVAVVSIGGLRLCVPVDLLRHAMERPQHMSAIPRRNTPVLGMFYHRDKPVPLVDLVRWVDIPDGGQAPGGSERVLVLGDGMRSIGVLVHAVESVRRVKQTAIRRAHHLSSAEEIFESVVSIDGEATPLPLMEPARLMALAQVWTDGQDDAESSSASTVAGESTVMRAERYAILRIANMLIGFKALDLAELVRRPKVQALSIGSMSGICEWRTRHVPVTDLAATLGQEAPSAAAPWLAVLLADGFAVAIPIHELKRIATIQDADIKPAPEHLRSLGFVLGQVQDDSGEAIYLLNAATLIGHSPNAAISRMTTVVAAGTAAHQQQRNTQPYLVFDAGNRYCAPLEGIREIVALKEGETDALRQAGATVPWRGIQLEVCRIEGAHRDGADAGALTHHLLIVEQGAGWKAVLINDVRRIVPANRAVISKFTTANGQNINFLTVGDKDKQESVSIVRLVERA